MIAKLFGRGKAWSVAALILVCGISAFGQAPRPKKVYIETDMEGVDGIYDADLQCIPFKSPRWNESLKLMTDEINSAVDGLLEGGATDIYVGDNHTGGGILSLLTLHPKAKLIVGFHSKPSTLGLDSSFSAMIFIGRHAMSGAENAILPHSNSREWRLVTVNDVPVGEFGMSALVGASFGIPSIMVSGDTAACKEADKLIPGIECAEVKSGFNATSGIMLPHAEALTLIHDKARHAMEHLAEFKPYHLTNPVTIKVQLMHNLGDTSEVGMLSRGAEELPDWVYAFHGRDYLEAYRKLVGK
jgi:D-amino peptidase